MNTVTTSSFEFNYHNSEKHSSSNCDEYVRHNIDVFNSMDIADKSFNACYQTAMSYIHNDYSTPSRKLGLSDNSTDAFLLKLNNLVESELEDDEIMDELAEESKLAKEDIKSLYYALNENLIDAQNFMNSLDLDIVFINDFE